MAAYNPNEYIDAVQAKQLGLIDPEGIFLGLDKDDTLIDGDDAPINGRLMYYIIQWIIAKQKTIAWTILSTGSAGFTSKEAAYADKTIQEFSQQVVDPSAKNWRYPNYGHYVVVDDKTVRNGFVNLFTKMNPQAPDNNWAKEIDQELGKKHHISFADVVQHGIISYSRSGELILTYSSKKEGGEPIIISIPTNAKLILNLNGMEVILYMKPFIENRAYHLIGDNKFFQLLSAMALDNCALVPNEQIKNLGVDIKAPRHFKWIERFGILDDKPTVVGLLLAAGAKALRANSPYVLQKENYLSELNRFQEKAEENGWLEYLPVIEGAKAILEASKENPNSYIESLCRFFGFNSIEDLCVQVLKLEIYKILNNHSGHVVINEENIVKKIEKARAVIASVFSTPLVRLGYNNGSLDNSLYDLAVEISKLESIDDILQHIIKRSRQVNSELETLQAKKTLLKKDIERMEFLFDFKERLSELRVTAMAAAIEVSSDLNDLGSICQTIKAKIQEFGEEEARRFGWKALEKRVEAKIKEVAASQGKAIYLPSSSSSSSSVSATQPSGNLYGFMTPLHAEHPEIEARQSIDLAIGAIETKLPALSRDVIADVEVENSSHEQFKVRAEIKNIMTLLRQTQLLIQQCPSLDNLEYVQQCIKNLETIKEKISQPQWTGEQWEIVIPLSSGKWFTVGEPTREVYLDVYENVNSALARLQQISTKLGHAHASQSEPGFASLMGGIGFHAHSASANDGQDPSVGLPEGVKSDFLDEAKHSPS